MQLIGKTAGRPSDADMTPRQFLAMCRDVTLRPRRTLSTYVGTTPLLALLVLGLASGAVQTLVNIAGRNGAARLGAGTILLVALLPGAGFGVVQLLLLSGSIATVSKLIDAPVPFGRVVSALALSATPNAYALTAWLLGTVFLGADLYVDPGALAASLPPVAALQVFLLYLGTLACGIWSLFLSAHALKAARGGTAWAAFGLLVTSTFALALAIAIIAFIALAIFVF